MGSSLVFHSIPEQTKLFKNLADKVIGEEYISTAVGKSPGSNATIFSKEDVIARCTPYGFRSKIDTHEWRSSDVSLYIYIYMQHTQPQGV